MTKIERADRECERLHARVREAGLRYYAHPTGGHEMQYRIALALEAAAVERWLDLRLDEGVRP